MERIKAYTNIHPENISLSFDAKRMEDIYERSKGKTDEPHRHEYYTILLIKQAQGKHIIDFNSFDLLSKQAYFISPGQVHQIIEEQKSYGYAFTFTRQFMAVNNIEKCFIDDLHLFQNFGYSPPLELDDVEFEKLSSIAEEIITFNQSNQKFKYQAVGALLKLFLVHCNNSCSLTSEENTQTVQASVSLLRSFKELLDQKFAQWHKVSEYAEALHITPNYLNTSVKSLSGKSAKEHIQNRIIVSAKRHLLHSSLSNKEIAYKMGFSEPANFSQFFKKCTGISPSAFRKQYNTQISQFS